MDLEKSVESGTGEPVGCSVQNMTKLEDVARIDHIFCDKTGTLTQNKLIFKFLVFGEKEFAVVNQTRTAMFNYANDIQGYLQELEPNPIIKEKYPDLWRSICICHDVIQVSDDVLEKKKQVSESK